MGAAPDISTIHRAILESMGEGVIFINAEDRLTFINHTAEQIRGIKAENFIGRHILTIHSPTTAERVKQLLSGLKDGSIQQTRRVIEVKGKYFENSYYPIRATEGSYLGAVLVSRDITEKQLLKEENRLLRDQMGLGDAFNDFVGTSQPILQLFQTIAAIATLDSTILITGESGTGKELVAAAVRQHSKRLNKPVVKVNCAALPENLVESELFGHERGAFSGAFSSHRGKFELAHGGTIFLDEIGDLPPIAQAKLLRVLQDRTITRVGGEKEIAVDVRIIAATNQDLQSLVALGRFREDLYYRLNVITIHVPPLRERREDIISLAEYFLRRFAEKMGRPIKGISQAAAHILAAYDYPGNVRELEHAIERGVALCGGENLMPQDLPAGFLAAGGRTTPVRRDNDTRPLSRSLDDFEHQVIRDALAKTGGRKQEAARLLNISRKTLWQKLKQMENG
ncbi:sigma-54 interaction domain-containing protein [Oryzomonas rubra]|uniref:PAS domain S-box protein n=1 Tax=Oryzomonas rubra TaxID=2509454 RepID=A0A5A9XGM3_9BACT|nr:sigma 54-interacting transcriptional regulator [Oryzomonas rubra]KAA0892054.1 PAS domain S-box protein [Oryzomonas rubra]